MLPLLNSEKNKIKVYIKNRLDISELLLNKDIRGLDLSHAIIGNLDRPNGDISHTVFYNAKIGTDGKVVNWSNCKVNDCNFKRAEFKGKLIVRRADLRRCNFTGAKMFNVDYRYADFRNCRFCSIVMKIGTHEGQNARFSKDILEALTEGWIIE